MRAGRVAPNCRVRPLLLLAVCLLLLPACSRQVTAIPVPTATLTLLPGSTPDQYRVWMEEARALHPYPEPVEAMWAVMLCESEGNPDAVGENYYGLFQYAAETWAGDWNPYRDYPIFDPHAQILATAQAWHDGNQVWWSGCLPGQ